MKVVADYLVKHSSQCKDLNDRDLFARSGFNRYYYAVFLIVRQTLSEIEPAWRNTPHSLVPVKLRENFTKLLQQRANKALKSKALAADAEKHKSVGISAASELANLMEDAYAVRVKADYHPEIRVVFIGSTISLHGEKISQAESWVRRAHNLSKTILSSAKGLGIV